MDGIFDVVLRSPLGPRMGTLALRRNGEALQGSLSFFSTENAIVEGTVIGNRYLFSGTVATAAGAREYRAAVTIENDLLSGEITFYLRTIPVKIPLPVPMKLTGKRNMKSGRY